MTGTPAKVQAKILAYRWLARRDHSSGELKAKWRAKGIPDEAIEETLAMLQEKGLVRDEACVARELRKGFGSRRIEQKLGLQGLGISREQEKEALLSSLAKCRGKSREQTLRFLARRGFDWDLIREAFSSETFD